MFSEKKKGTSYEEVTAATQNLYQILNLDNFYFFKSKLSEFLLKKHFVKMAILYHYIITLLNENKLHNIKFQ